MSRNPCALELEAGLAHPCFLVAVWELYVVSPHRRHESNWLGRRLRRQHFNLWLRLFALLFVDELKLQAKVLVCLISRPGGQTAFVLPFLEREASMD